MAYVYSGFLIQNRVDVLSTGHVITTNKGDLVSDNGTKTSVLSLGTNGQFLKVDTSTSTGLAYANITVADIGLVAGTGLVLTGNTLDVVGSNTIVAAANNIYVNSNATASQPLLSVGTVGNEAIYGALPLNNSNSVTGTLDLVHGGTNNTSYTSDTLVAANVGATSLVSTAILTSDVVTLNGVQTQTNKSLIDPKIYTKILDSFGNISIEIPGLNSAVNYPKLQNSLTGVGPTISAQGTDTNIDLNLAGKGTGKIDISGIKYPNADGLPGQVLTTNGSGTLSFADVELSYTGSASVPQATSSTLFTFVTAPNTTYYVVAKFVGKNGAPTTYASSWFVRATFYNNGSTLTRVGGSAGIDIAYIPATTTANADVAVSSTNIVFNILADATAGTQQWKVYANISSV